MVRCRASPVTDTDPFAAAIRIARGSKSPMEKAASALDPERYRIFCATYASMRQIDDFVDDEFLALPADRRAAEADAALGTVAAWRDAAVAALEGGDGGDGPPRFHETTAALKAVSRGAALDAGPWRRLADAMARDVRQAPMRSWDDFLAYAEGATAAPAAVFIEILALRRAEGDRLASALEGPAVERIRNSAVLLYLVHIMRDLAEDAAQGPGLLTLPDSFFTELGTDAAAFSAAAPGDAALIARARVAVARYAERFLAPAIAEIAALSELLGSAEADILTGLCMPYIERYETFAAGT